MKEKITLESLARMVANGFTEMKSYMDERFDDVDKRFDDVDNRFDEVDKKFDRVNKRIDETNRIMDVIVVPALDDHSRRIKDLELKVA